ncbi:hypothetical protein BGX38DRAFT_1209830 [Terfezia claveryi]|nr:hypothetical protein BGX38DRAFT_1209830 [Terfezia claveryi]
MGTKRNTTYALISKCVPDRGGKRVTVLLILICFAPCCKLISKYIVTYKTRRRV